MITVSIRNNFSDAFKKFEQAQGNRARIAMANALNETASRVRLDQVEEMKSAFHMPTRYTLNSLYLKRALPARLQAVVWLKDGYDDRKQHYLHPQIFSGARVEKRFEFMLRRIGVLPTGMFAVPGNSAQLDAYGNMSRAEIVKILSYVQAFYLAGATQNSTAATREKMAKGSAKKKGLEYIVVRQKRGGLVPGIWKVEKGGLGRSVRPVLIFVRGASYSARYRFQQVGEQSIETRFPAAWRKAWEASAGIKG